MPEPGRGARPVQTSPWPTSRCSGSKRAERLARRREAQQQVDAHPVAPRPRRTGSSRPPRRRRASAARPPERTLVPAPRLARPDRLERRPGQRVRHDEVRDAELARRPRRSRGCGGRGAGERRPARRAPTRAGARARGGRGRRARPGRRRRARGRCASSARRRSRRSRAHRGRRRSGSSRSDGTRSALPRAADSFQPPSRRRVRARASGSVCNGVPCRGRALGRPMARLASARLGSGRRRGSGDDATPPAAMQRAESSSDEMPPRRAR